MAPQPSEHTAIRQCVEVDAQVDTEKTTNLRGSGAQHHQLDAPPGAVTVTLTAPTRGATDTSWASHYLHVNPQVSTVHRTVWKRCVHWPAKERKVLTTVSFIKLSCTVGTRCLKDRSIPHPVQAARRNSLSTCTTERVARRLLCLFGGF